MTPDVKRVAGQRRAGDASEIRRVFVGSGVPGTAVDGQDDRDEMGI